MGLELGLELRIGLGRDRVGVGLRVRAAILYVLEISISSYSYYSAPTTPTTPAAAAAAATTITSTTTTTTTTHVLESQYLLGASVGAAPGQRHPRRDEQQHLCQQASPIYLYIDSLTRISISGRSSTDQAADGTRPAEARGNLGATWGQPEACSGAGAQQPARRQFHILADPRRAVLLGQRAARVQVRAP